MSINKYFNAYKQQYSNVIVLKFLKDKRSGGCGGGGVGKLALFDDYVCVGVQLGLWFKITVQLGQSHIPPSPTHPPLLVKYKCCAAYTVSYRYICSFFCHLLNPVLRSRKCLFLAPAPTLSVILAPATATVIYCHLIYSITVVPY